MECKICGQDNPPIARFCANCGATLSAQATETSLKAEASLSSTQSATGVAYVGFLTRFAAATIDAIVVWLFYFVLSSFSYLFPLYLRLSLVFLLAGLLYFWLFTGLKGQTLGKMLLGIKVVTIQGDKPGLTIAALREILGKALSAIVLFLGFFWIALDVKKQGWHDKIANTFVVHK